MRLRASVDIKRRSKAALDKALLGLSGIARGAEKVDAGFPEGSPADIAQVAAFQEFGTRTIPARPFIRTSLRANRGKYQKAMREAAKEVLWTAVKLGDARAAKRQALEKLGALAAADIRAELDAFTSPPNAPSTIRQKGSSHPLIDSGEMRSRITYKVRE